MCGVAGIIDFNGNPIDARQALVMAAAQAHRGPDGEGAVFFFDDGRWQNYEVLDPSHIVPKVSGAVGALTHRRLAIIDLSEQGGQPMADPHGALWITYNGEIYNYLELRKELQAAGYLFKSASDTEVIIHAYSAWGIDCLQRLNGMFAFALWDNRHRRLFCARDRLGIKPFYYHYQKGQLFFSSEPKAIIAAFPQRTTVNIDAMVDFLGLSYVLTDETMFQGIRRLPPGEWLVADISGIRTGSYWNPSFEPDRVGSRQERIEELRALLNDAMRLQIRSDVPIGAHLSGGIDSSLVCSLAARCVPRLQTFSARFTEGRAFDESPYARLVAQRLQTEHHEMVPNAEQLTDVLPHLLYQLDEPVEAAAIFGKYHVASEVSQAVKVVLTGHGGDEIFGGYDWYIKNLFTAACFGAPGVLGDHPRHSFLWQTLTREEQPKRLVKSLWKNRGDSDLGRIFFRNWNRTGPNQAAQIFRPEIFDKSVTTSQQRFLNAYQALPEQRAGDRMFRFDMRHYLQSLLTSEDRLSMSFSVEARVPLLDHRIVEFAGRLGFESKTQPGCSKPWLREASTGIVPPEVLARRDKRGFPTPVARWLSDPKLNLFDTLVFNNNTFAEQYFDLDYLRALHRKRIHFGSDWSEVLWRVLNLSVWGQVFELG